MFNLTLPVSPGQNTNSGIAQIAQEVPANEGIDITWSYNGYTTQAAELIPSLIFPPGSSYPEIRYEIELPSDLDNLIYVIVDGQITTDYFIEGNRLIPNLRSVDSVTYNGQTPTVTQNQILQIIVLVYQPLVIAIAPGVPVLASAIASNKICNYSTVDLFERLNIEESEVIVTETLGEPPSLSAIAFVICKDEVSSLKTRVYNGLEFWAFDHKWVINSVNITFLSNSEQAVVGISCVHWSVSRGSPSKSPLDKKVRTKQVSGNFASKATLSKYASITGVNYRGVDITCRVPKSTTKDDSTTVREVLGRLINKHHVVDYRRDYINSFGWANTPLVAIAQSEVLSDINISINGHGTKLDGVPLHTEYRNYKVNLDFDQDVDDSNTGVTIRWAYENCRDFGDLVSPKEFHGFYYTSPDPEIFRNIGICFDAGGLIKKATKIIELNGTPTFEEHWEYGYAFTSRETHEIVVTPQGNYIIKLNSIQTPENYWKEVSHTTTDHVYDEDGYLVKSITTGTQLARLQQESEKLESVNLQAQANYKGTNGIPDPSLQAQSDAYEYVINLPIYDATDYILHRHSSYFDDTVKPSDKCDSDFVEPKFVRTKSRSSSSQVVKDNPKNNETFTYPPVVTGKFLSESEETVITNRKKPKFEVRTSQQNSEGEYAKNTIALGNVTQNNGKPGVASRLDREINPNPQNGNSNSDRFKNSNYFLNPVSPILEEGSIGFTDIDDPSTVRAIAETQLSIINTQNAMIANFEIKYRSDLRVGDRILFKNQTWVLLSKIDSKKLNKNYAYSSKLELQLGRLLKPNLSLIDKGFC